MEHIESLRSRTEEVAMPITVLLTYDEEAVRISIRRLLDSDPEIHTVGEAVNFQQTIQRAIELKPQIVIMDLRMAVNSSVNPQEIKSQLKTLGSRLIAMSSWNDEDAQALAERLGAATLLDKLTLTTDLIPAIEAESIKRRSADA
jgi:DNA-binding NarL/FixJ family response regulator